MLRRCPRCGQPFEGHKEQRLCPECREAAQRAPRIGTRTCKTCGKTFEGGPRAWYCPECRAERQKDADRRSKAAARSGKTRQLGSIDICARCGREYTVMSGLQRYCPECGPQVAREKSAPAKREYAAKQRQDPEYNKHTNQIDGTICVVCGKPFTATTPTNTCSPECAEIQRHRVQHAADVRRGKAGKREK